MSVPSSSVDVPLADWQIVMIIGARELPLTAPAGSSSKALPVGYRLEDPPPPAWLQSFSYPPDGSVLFERPNGQHRTALPPPPPPPPPQSIAASSVSAKHEPARVAPIDALNSNESTAPAQQASSSEPTGPGAVEQRGDALASAPREAIDDEGSDVELDEMFDAKKALELARAHLNVLELEQSVRKLNRKGPETKGSAGADPAEVVRPDTSSVTSLAKRKRPQVDPGIGSNGGSAPKKRRKTSSTQRQQTTSTKAPLRGSWTNKYGGPIEWTFPPLPQSKRTPFFRRAARFHNVRPNRHMGPHPELPDDEGVRLFTGGVCEDMSKM
ncbi:hypothetical protein JCM16303_005051 [Sporobolomyces ruberrimus]